MGSFDDAMKNAVPGGNLATPIAVAVGALILGKMFGGSSSPASSPASTPSIPIPPPGQPVPTNAPAGSILGGLTDLIGKLSAGGVCAAGQFLGRSGGERAGSSPDSSVRRSARMCLPNFRSAPA